MRLILKRFRDNGTTTHGLLFAAKPIKPPLKPEVPDFLCFTVEDTYRQEKVKHQTRIPAGVYEIKLRKEGSFHDKYRKKFPFHKGMLWLQNVPNFEFILIHLGNTSDDSSGCILVDDILNSANPNGASGSLSAYERIYSPIANALDAGERVEICIQDESQWLI